MARRHFTSPAPEHHADSMGFKVWRMDHGAAMAAAHTHPDIEVNFLTEGGFSYLHGGAILPVEPFRFTVLWGGVPHCTLAATPRQDGIWITLPLGWFLRWQLPNHLAQRLFGGEIVAARPDEADRTLLERWLRDFKGAHAGRRHALMLELEARFHRLAWDAPARTRKARAIPPAGSGMRQMERITAYVARHYREPLTIGQIAAALRLHGKYLMRLFKRQSRISVWEYVTRMRLSHAQRLLLTTDMKVVDLALEAGFASVGPFYRAFAAYSSGPKRPLDYRRRLER